MKILIIGGAGFVGSALVENLVKNGYEVDVVDILWFGNNLPKECKLIKKNALNLTKKDLEGYEQTLFLAGLSNDPMAELSGPHNFIYNTAIPTYIAFLCKEAGVKRFIFASSASVYGFTNNELYNEKNKPLTVFPYGISKLQAENGISQLIDNNFSVISVRKGTICGYSPRMRFDLVVNTMFKTAILNKKIIINNPNLFRPILSVKDAIKAYELIIQSPINISGCFNILSENINIKELGESIKNIITKELNLNIKLEIFNKQDFRSYQISGEKFKSTFGYTPTFFVRDIIYELIHHKNEFGDFSNKNYYNIEIFKKIYENWNNRF